MQEEDKSGYYYYIQSLMKIIAGLRNGTQSECTYVNRCRFDPRPINCHEDKPADLNKCPSKQNI